MSQQSNDLGVGFLILDTFLGEVFRAFGIVKRDVMMAHEMEPIRVTPSEVVTVEDVKPRRNTSIFNLGMSGVYIDRMPR